MRASFYEVFAKIVLRRDDTPQHFAPDDRWFRIQPVLCVMISAGYIVHVFQSTLVFGSFERFLNAIPARVS